MTTISSSITRQGDRAALMLVQLAAKVAREDATTQDLVVAASQLVGICAAEWRDSRLSRDADDPQQEFLAARVDRLNEIRLDIAIAGVQMQQGEL